MAASFFPFDESLTRDIDSPHSQQGDIENDQYSLHINKQKLSKLYWLSLLPCASTRYENTPTAFYLPVGCKERVSTPLSNLTTIILKNNLSVKNYFYLPCPRYFLQERFLLLFIEENFTILGLPLVLDLLGGPGSCTTVRDRCAILFPLLKLWRGRQESNLHTRSCSPLHSLSVTSSFVKSTQSGGQA